ncbi:YkgJ family cysteine cluster protein [Terrarubrum flagellatum]|uniref:YkgJ family cysteine cluster protein n=1 Tax=Terrirubrum flagellatum TaxID=2895980 RepID=UPI003144FE16
MTRRDVARLARHFDISPEAAEKRFTKSASGYDRVLRRQRDDHYGHICRFFDTDKRRCTVYEARPQICREFPGEARCGYYDFLTFEREHQRDPEHVATTNSAP